MPCALSYAEEDRTGLLLNGAISLEHTDNVLNKLETLAESDTAYSIKPSAQYLGLVGKHKFTFNYDGNLARHIENSKLDYNEHNINALVQLEHTHRINTEFRLSFDREIEEPGSTNASTFALTQFNKYINKRVMSKIYYGQNISTGQIVIEYNYNDKEYINNGQEFRDRYYNQFIGTFFYRIAPKTRTLLQIDTGKYIYNDIFLNNNSIFNQSNKLNTYFLGIQWDATAKSTGIFKIGYLNIDYMDSTFNDVSGLSYDLDIIWKPHPFTKVSLSATKKATDSAQINNQGSVRTIYSIDASYQLQTRTDINTKYTFNNSDFDSNRIDKRQTIHFGIKHNFKTWLNVNLYYKYQERTSNIELFEYDTKTIGLTVETLFK